MIGYPQKILKSSPTAFFIYDLNKKDVTATGGLIMHSILLPTAFFIYNLKINNKKDVAAHLFLDFFCFCRWPSKIIPTAENDTAYNMLYMG